MSIGDRLGIGVERALLVGVGLAAAEAVALGVVVAARGHRSAGAVLTVLVLKLIFCRGALRRRPGSLLALFLYEGVTVLFAVSAPGVPWPGRLALAAAALTVLVLLGLSARLFPSPPVPRP